MPSHLPPAEIKNELAHIKDDRSHDMVVSCAICITAAIAAVILRFIARRLSKAKIMADDWMIVVALVFCMGQVATVFYTVHLGAGRHVVLLKDPPAYAKTIISMERGWNIGHDLFHQPSEVLYCVGTSAFKWSALLLFHRIFGSVRRFTIVLWVVAGVILANNIAEIFLSVFQCNPVHKAWEQSVPGSCVNIILAACIPGAVNVLCDFITVLLPIPMIWGLHMQLNRKLQLVGIFLLSGFVCIASIYRTIIVRRLSHFDASWADVDPEIWAVVENAIGIVSASLPTMRPIYSVLLRGHHCNSSQKQYCEKCTSRSKPSVSGGSGAPTTRGPIRNESVPSVVESMEKRPLAATAHEIC